ncbi:unnamed protein product [Somion occarium]|uniref:Magnesium transport protein CorA n=1 Tax=Somion occarium TaxID=3059160 RepID=A0ABP1CGR0_9APHY
MPRENSFSDSDGRSLTPDLEDELGFSPTSPTSDHAPAAFLGTPAAGQPARHGRPTLETLEDTLSAPSLLPSQPKSPRSPKSLIRNSFARSRSPNGRTSTQDAAPIRPSLVTPGERFRSSVRKVMAMRKTSAIISRHGIGAEPGIDPRRSSANLTYGHIRQHCLIEIADYSAVRSSFGRMSNAEFIKLMADPRASAREPWVKVRWINIGGISWDVISAIAIKYDIHPLALEDVLHQRGHARSKVDYYNKHLFLRLLRHSLSNEKDGSTGSTPNTSVTDLPRSSSPEPMEVEEVDIEYDGKDGEDEKTEYGSASGSKFSTKRGGTLRNTVKRQLGNPVDVEDRMPRSPRLDTSQLDKKGDERVNVKIAPMCIFLFRDGTVITIHQDNRLNFTSPITGRLRQRDTGLRTTADPSLLVESLIDLVVDQALEVVEEYQSKILSLEHNVLVKPTMTSVRRLHILQGDLILHKRTLEPIKTVIYGLRRYDIDRVAALSERIDPTVKIEGYMSHKSKIYLADVYDHMEYILTSLDMFAGISENLINYTFNMSSYEMNEVMRRLTLATIIFLPLTLLTGYFGMNFEAMWSVRENSDALFWYIAAPVMVVVITIFMWQDLQRMAHYLKKRYVQRMVKKEVKKDFKKSQ